MYVCACVCVNNSLTDVQQKLTQQCKSTVLQYKNNSWLGMQLGSGTIRNTREYKSVRIHFVCTQGNHLFICSIFLSLCVNQLVPFHGLKLADEELPG